MIKSGDNYVWNETYVSERNTTTTPLASGATYTGDWERCGNKTSVLVRIFSDKKCQYFLEFSPDKTLITSSIPLYFDPSRINVPNRFTIGDDYYRLRIVNSDLENMTQLAAFSIIGIKELLNFPLDGVLPQKADSLVVRGIAFEDEVCRGRREGKTPINAYGKNIDLDSGTPELVAPYGGSLVIIDTAETLNISSSSANDTDGGSGARQVRIRGVDNNWDLQEETVTLNGTSTVTTSNAFLGVSEMEVVSSGSSRVNEGTITVTNSTTGNIVSQIDAEDGIDLKCVYFVPRNHDMCLRWLYFNCRKLAGGTAPRILFDIKTYNSDTNTIKRILPIRVDTSVENQDNVKIEIPKKVDEKSIIFVEATTNTNDTVVNFSFSGILYQQTDIVV